jgi:hypothetical protein
LVPTALAAGLAFLFAVAASGTASAASIPELCRGDVVRDDERPLERMPSEHPPPEGELGFGPRNLSMYPLNFGAKVVLDGGHLGYRFAAKGGNRRVLRLNWDIRAVLRAVDGEGRVLSTVDATRRRLGAVEGLDLLQFSFPASPGIYRIDLSFRNLSGRRLASYREHFRVVPRLVKLRLVVNEPIFGPAETAYARVLNLGTVPVGLRPGLSIERAEGDRWVEVARPPVPPQQVNELRWTLLGGEASPCVAFRIPADVTPGLFRFASSALVFGQEVDRRTLKAVFRVRPGGGVALKIAAGAPTRALGSDTEPPATCCRRYR